MTRFLRLPLLLAALGAASHAAALECPQLQSVARSSIIKQPQDVIASLAPLLEGPDVSQRAGQMVASVRSRYPEAPAADIVNVLVAAYCPVANRLNVPEADKTAMVNAFAAAVTQQLY